MQETTTYRVDGMTCDHCKAAVTTSVEALPGVEKAEVDLQTGRLTITRSGPLWRTRATRSRPRCRDGNRRPGGKPEG